MPPPAKKRRKAPPGRGSQVHQRARRAPPIGSQPGALALPDDALPPLLHAMRFGPDYLEESDLERDADLAALLGKGDVVWLDIQGLGDSAFLERVRVALDLHPLALADIVNVPQRPKVEAFGDRVLIVAQMAQFSENGSTEIEQLSLVLGPHWIATIQERPGDCFDGVRERIRTPGSRIRSQSAAYLGYALLDAVTDAYFPIIEGLAETLDRIEDSVLTQPSGALVHELHSVRRTLLLLHRIQWQQREALGAMARDPDLPFQDSLRLFLRDVYDHAFQILDAIEAQREISLSLMDLYLSSANQRLNEAMRTLTVVATIFIPLTFVTSVYGMNFDYFPELHWRWAYPAVWGVMLTTAAGLLLWFQRRGWIGRRP